MTMMKLKAYKHTEYKVHVKFYVSALVGVIIKVILLICYVSAICKHSWDPNMYAAFTDFIPKKVR